MKINQKYVTIYKNYFISAQLMCFYCHKLYNFPYAPLHGHLNCPELAKINKDKINLNSDIKSIQPNIKSSVLKNPNEKTLDKTLDKTD